ncbi:wd-40 repeat protein [Stylonychia lemnae]|uniref:Wd-40 repeat protein n=1 Tax=Stylonychia lemnae TaxID=5949 RepID=A0A078AGX5_STYLE|nr:wd-40 repeat protein [Stylonychia lemnae]|eukprot:CDW81515.1 wd-40 repeat protein [Stylonychia lemnae]
MGFGEAFLRLAEASNDDELKFVQNFADAFVYIYRMSLGDNSTDAYEMSVQSTYIWILFVFAGILMSIVLLNLLIAIISLSFERINEKADLAAFQERARIIFENQYLIPNYVKRSLDDKNKFLGIIIDATAIKDQQEDQTSLKLNQLEIMIKDQYDTSKNDFLRLSQQQDEIKKQLSIQQELLQKILKAQKIN